MYTTYNHVIDCRVQSLGTVHEAKGVMLYLIIRLYSLDEALYSPESTILIVHDCTIHIWISGMHITRRGRRKQLVRQYPLLMDGCTVICKGIGVYHFVLVVRH